MTKTENFIQIEVTSSTELREWLLQNHTQKESIWLVTFKKQSVEKYVSNNKFLTNCSVLVGLTELRES